MRAALFALLIVFCATPAAADRFTMNYDGAALGFIPLGNIVVDANIDDSTYEITIDLTSGGLLNLFERTNLHAVSSGLITGDAVRWRSYDLDHHYSHKHRVIEMRVGDDGAVSAAITPNYRIWGNPPASAAQQRGARDPLSTIVAMSVDVGGTRRCAGDYPTFDGRFYYLLELNGGRIDHYNGGGYDGDVLKCDLAYIAVAGFEQRDIGRRRVPHGEVWFALAPHSRFAPPVHISTPLSAGAAVVRMTRWRRVAVEIDDATAATP